MKYPMGLVLHHVYIPLNSEGTMSTQSFEGTFELNRRAPEVTQLQPQIYASERGAC